MIVDQFGRPIETGTLAESQTARIAPLHNQFSEHPSQGLTVAKIARIMREAEQGSLREQCELFEDMEEKDTHIFAEMSKRKRALLGIDWDIVPPRNASKQEEAAAAFVKEVLLDIENFDDVILDALDGIGKGYACQEIDWHRPGREWVPKTITHHPASWFTTPQFNRSQIRLDNNTADGEELWPFKWVMHTHKAKSGYIARTGLHRVLVWPYLFKNYGVRDLAEFLEIYGLPLRLGTYPSGASDVEKSTLLKAVVNIGHSAAGIVPEGMMIDFKEAAEGTEKPFGWMIDWCEGSESKAILGGTLTSQTDQGSGAYALGEVHNEVRHDLTKSDAMQLGKTLTRDLVYPLAALNKSGIDSAHRAPRFIFDTREQEDVKGWSEALPKFVEVGMKIPAQWAHEKTNIPMADENEEVLKVETASPGAPSAAQTTAAIAALTAHDKSIEDIADKYADRAGDAAVQVMSGLPGKVQQLAMAANSLEEIRDGLLSLYPAMETKSMAALLQRSFAAAELAGRFEVNEGN